MTHRIRSIGRDPKTNSPVFRTKGDANDVADPWTFTLPNRNQARAVTGAPYMGFVLAALADRKYRRICTCVALMRRAYRRDGGAAMTSGVMGRGTRVERMHP